MRKRIMLIGCGDITTITTKLIHDKALGEGIPIVGYNNAAQTTGKQDFIFNKVIANSISEISVDKHGKPFEKPKSKYHK